MGSQDEGYVDNNWLVVEPTQFEKYARQNGNLPQFSG